MDSINIQILFFVISLIFQFMIAFGLGMIKLELAGLRRELISDRKTFFQHINNTDIHRAYIK